MGKEEKKDDGLTLITPSGIACFVHVWEPHAFTDNKGNKGDLNYGLILVFNKKTDLSEMRKTCDRALIKKWGEAKAKAMKLQFRLPFRDASDYSEYGEPFRDDGSIMVNFKSKNAPGVVNARAKPIMNQMDFYAGVIARVSCYAHAYDSMGNKGVTFLLNNVQKMADGERLSGAQQNAEDEFGPISEGGGEEDADDLF